MRTMSVRETLIGLTLHLIVVATAHGASFTVNDVADLADASPGDGLCEVAPGGVCTLRAAVQETNALAGADQIALPTGTYTLTTPPTGPNDAVSGDLNVTDDVAIDGDVSATTIVDGSALDRVFTIGSPFGPIAVRISRITVRNGANTTDPNGGGGIASFSSLQLVDCVVSNNHDSYSGSFGGGGIFNAGGSLTLARCLVANNTSAVQAGGILNAGTLSMLDTAVVGNSSRSGGGLVSAGGTVTLDRCTVSGNTATGPGGDPLTGAAGGIGQNGGTLSLTNVTVSGNTARNSGGGLWTSGGVDIRSSTITGNVADSDADGSGDGGAIYLYGAGGGPITVRNAIVAGNTDGGGQAPDCAAPLTSEGYNLLQATAGCTVSGDTTGNVSGLSANLGPLQSNGGVTQTHALLAGSPALGAGNPTAPGSGGTACPSTDQREIARPQGTRCDMGAYEAALLGGARTFSVNSPSDALDFQPGDDVCETASGNGICTLRAAVQEANAKSGSDTIFLPAGFYSFTRAGANEEGAVTGDLDLTDNATIVGGGAGVTTIDAAGLDRVLDVKSGASVQVIAARISGGVADDGGGIRNRGQLTLTDCVVRNNTANGEYPSGGGIESSGTLTLTGSVVRSNQLANSYGSGAGMEVSGSTVVDRSAIFSNGGGGAYWGGGIMSFSSLTVTDSELWDNVAAVGGALWIYGSATVRRSALYSNISAYGAGVYVTYYSGATLEDSTVTANIAYQDGGGAYVYQDSGYTGSLTLANVTMSHNVADYDANGIGDGGGVRGPATARNTILAQNTDGSGQAPNCASSPLTSQGYNLLGSLAGCSVTGSTTGNLVGVDPQLGTLQYFGGYTPGRPLAATSPARNAGNPAVPGSGGAACTASDQRSVSRPQGARCEIGAYEEIVQCGDGAPDPGEQCDDGNTNNKDACTNACTTAVCGDGLVRTGIEECDDGATPGGDGCEANCTLTSSSVTATVAAGEPVTTDTDGNGASPSNPVEASVTSPTAGTVTLTRNPSTTPPGSFMVLGGVTQISAPPGTPSAPLVLVFSLDAGLIPAGQTAATIQIRKNGSIVPPCTGAPGIASPDPCVSQRTTLSDGDIQLTVLSSTASAWELGTLACGNGAIDAGEACDDGGSIAGDGCDATCQVEGGCSCSGMPSACSCFTRIGIVPKKLSISDNVSKAKVGFSAKHPAVTKGAATDPSDIEVTFTATYANAATTGRFVLPLGDAGWLANSPSGAKFVNKGAPGGTTQASGASIKPGKSLKLVAKGLGDVPIDIAGAGDPAGSVFTAYCVRNGGTAYCHCAELTTCTYKPGPGGAGAKLTCKGGVADPTCVGATP